VVFGGVADIKRFSGFRRSRVFEAVFLSDVKNTATKEA
jgi:hypothetical protein